MFGINGKILLNLLEQFISFYDFFLKDSFYWLSNHFVNSLTVYYSNDEALIYLGTDSKNYL